MTTKKDTIVKGLTGEDVVVETPQVDRTSTFMKLAGLALGSYWLSEKDPYVLEGFSKELKRQEEAAEATENEFIKGASSSIAKVLAENELDRKKRVNENLETIEILTGYGMDSALAAKAKELNMGKELVQIRAKYPNIDLNKVFNEIKSTNVVGMSKKDMAQVLLGKNPKLKMNFAALQSPDRGTFLSNILNVDSQKYTQNRIKRIVESQDVRPTDTIDYAKGKALLASISKSDYGKRLLALYDEKEISQAAMSKKIAQNMESYFGVKVGMGVQGYTFESGSAENKKIASNVMSAIDAKVLEIYNDNLQKTQPNLDLTKTAIFNDIKNKITETVTIDKGEFEDADGIKRKRTEVISRLKKDKNGDYVANSVLGLRKGENAIPIDWKSATTGPSPSVNSTVNDDNGNNAGKSQSQLRKAAKIKIDMIKNSNISNDLKQKKIKAIKDKLDEDLANAKSHVN